MTLTFDVHLKVRDILLSHQYKKKTDKQIKLKYRKQKTLVSTKNFRKAVNLQNGRAVGGWKDLCTGEQQKIICRDMHWTRND